MRKTYILALAALAVAFSCNKNTVEEVTPIQEQEAAVRTFTFTCSFAEPDSKVAIDDATGKSTWEVGDEIFIHGKSASKSVIVTLADADLSEDKKTATFTVTLPDDPYDPDGYYAAYPASAYIEYSSDRCYYYGTFNETNLPLMCAYLSGTSFVFYNLCGVLSFIVDGDFDQILVAGNAGETVGYDRYNVKINSEERNFLRVSGTDGTLGAKTSITAPVVADGATVNRIYFPNGVTFSAGFTIKFLKGGLLIKTLSTTKEVVIARNSYRPMGDVTAYLKDYVAPSTHDSSIDMTGATALDASANANSYIVDGSVADNAGKVFTFKAYKGNSTAGVGDIASAEILWETWNDAGTVTANSVIAAVDFDKQDADDFYTMVFQMPDALHAGNAVLAAKDASDNILWSWHIWVPASGISTQDGTALCGAGIMDRNLGALVVTPMTGDPEPLSIGLFYQWGRKDPFPGTTSFTSNQGATVHGVSWTAHGEHITTAYSIAHPTEYAHIKEVDAGVWNVDDPKDLWNGEGNVKTIYDPCPPGYRVPRYNSSLPMWSGSYGDSWTIDKDNYRFAYGDISFPVGGYIDCWSPDYEKMGLRTHVWAANWYDAERSNCMYYREGSYYSQKFHKAKAGSVRCVVE